MNNLILITIHVASIIVLAKVAQVFARRFNLPTIPIQLLIGVLLGPSVIDLLGTPIILGTWGSVSERPLHGILKILAEVGLIQLLFLSGFQTDWLALKESRWGRLQVCPYVISVLVTGGAGFLLTGKPGGALAIEGGGMTAMGFGSAFLTLSEQRITAI